MPTASKTRSVLAFISVIALMASLSGCIGLVTEAFNHKNFSDEELLDKAEFAIGIDRADLSVIPGSVINKTGEVEYQVKVTTGATYRCYITYSQSIPLSFSSSESDANCSEITRASGKKSKTKSKSKKQSTGECNDLLRAAGRC